MAKKLIVLVLFLCIVAIPSSASAQTMRTLPANTSVTKAPVRLQTPLSNPAKQATGSTGLKNRGQEVKQIVQDRNAAFRAQIQEIKDTTKRSVVTRIAEKITKANVKITGAMSKALQNMSKILARLEAKAESLTANGANTTALLTSIVAAEEAIAAAQTAVDTQAAKEYTTDLTDDTTLATVISGLVAEFRADIELTKEAVEAARAAVIDVREQIKLLTPTDTNEASDSATIN